MNEYPTRSGRSENEWRLARGPVGSLLLRYALPGVIAMTFFALQSIVDGLIVGHWVGVDALAAVNIAFPAYTLMTALALVIGIGTQAQMGICLGKGEYGNTMNAFRTGLTTVLVFALVFTVVIHAFTEEIARFLGASGSLLTLAADYLHGVMPLLTGVVCFMFFDYMLKVLGHPRYAMCIMVGTILLNLGLSILFVVVYGMDTFGVGLGTGLSFTTGAVFSSVATFRQLRKDRALGRARSGFSRQMLWRIVYNGSSEGLSEIAMGISTFLFNITLMEYAGKEGVAAFTIIGYVAFIGSSFMLGVSNGVIPILSYNYGAHRRGRLWRTVALSTATNFVIGTLFMCVLWAFGRPIVTLFLDASETGVIALAVTGARIVGLGYLVSGFNVFAASFFTAVDKAGLSLVVSALRSLILIVIGIFTLPKLFGVNGIWLTLTFTEGTTFLVAVLLMRTAFKRINRIRI